jgi:hypothetical protein
MLAGATVISRLLLRPRLWAIRAIAAGRFGSPVTGPNGARRVPLASVEAAEGIQFTAEQLAAAGVHLEGADHGR